MRNPFRSVATQPFPALLGCALLLLAIKAVQLGLDAQPLFFLGDSISHLNAAVWNYVPNERSYVYGQILRATALAARDLQVVVVWQVLAGGLTAWLLAFGLLRFFSVRPAVAIAASVAFAWDPLQLLHERMVLCEAFTLLMLALNLLLALSYVRQPRVAPLLGVALTGIAMVSLRFMYIPVALAEALLLPLLAWIFPANRPFRRSGAMVMAIHLLVALSATLALHGWYRHEIGRRSHTPPTYYQMNGLFLIAAWAPVVDVADAADPVMAEALRQQLQNPAVPLHHPLQREAQLWDAEGLRQRLQSAFSNDVHAANQSAKQTCRNTLLRDPLGLARLTLQTLGRYAMNRETRRLRLLNEQGSDRDWPEALRTVMHEHYGDTTLPDPWRLTPLKRYHLASYPWCMILLGSPLLWLVALRVVPVQQRGGAVLLFLLSGMIMGFICVGTTVSVLRYLHPLSFTALMALGLLADRLLPSGARRGSP